MAMPASQCVFHLARALPTACPPGGRTVCPDHVLPPESGGSRGAFSLGCRRRNYQAQGLRSELATREKSGPDRVRHEIWAAGGSHARWATDDVSGIQIQIEIDVSRR